jgi:hypothetical protein
MKKLLSLIIMAFCGALGVSAQATLPSIMVRPGSQWCSENGYTSIVDNQGQSVEVCDYTQAMNNSKMLQSIIVVEGLLKDEGFKVPSLKGKTNAINEFSAEELLLDDEDGNVADKSALDISRERAYADIYLDINWSIEKVGPKKQLSYTLEGKDAYTGEDVCSVTGIGEPSLAASEATMLREAVIGKIPEMKDRLQNYLTTMLERGRNVHVAIRVSTGSNLHLESAVEGGTLGRVIYKWILKNAVQHRAEAERSSRTSANYNVNIALYDSDELPMSTEDFLWQLSDYLSGAPYGVKTRVANQGLGRATLFIQGKN